MESKIQQERERLEANVVQAAKEWIVELQRINATTYTDDNRFAEVLKSPVEISRRAHELVRFEESVNARLVESFAF